MDTRLANGELHASGLATDEPSFEYLVPCAIDEWQVYRNSIIVRDGVGNAF